jgi:hypothetical protein
MKTVFKNKNWEILAGRKYLYVKDNFGKTISDCKYKEAFFGYYMDNLTVKIY